MLRAQLLPLCLALLAPAHGQDPLAGLPVAPAVERARGDWLVEPVTRGAGAFRSADRRDLVLDNGLVRRTLRVAPNLACSGIDDLVTGNALVRAVRPEARVTLDGEAFAIGGLVGQPDHAYLSPDVLDGMSAEPGAFTFTGLEVGAPIARFPWKRVRHHDESLAWPPAGVHVRLDFAPPPGAACADARVSVHYELYDGLPLMAKWLTVENRGARALRVDRFTLEELAIVEHANWVEARAGVALPRPDCLHVETDFAFGGFNHENANRHVVHWREDSGYTSQVNYLMQEPCLLVVEPTYGPAQVVAPGATFTTFRTFELVQSGDRERRGLALRRMYRTLAPWVTENPLMHHMRTADFDAVRGAIDQAAEVGFEMIVLSFGSGFQVENDDPAYVARWKETNAYARSRGVELGGYSLLSSRRIGGGNDIVSPPGEKPTHGNCPALTSTWGQAYFAKLYAFFAETGFTLLEHDGSYPGDVDVTPRPPLQQGIDDSRWAQWRVISGFYQWCRGQGIYLNVPDYYFLAGSNKCGMGYREVNWSLPRAQQVLHTRQNIYDGTWTKTPSMGWMFVPLSQYHGGGAAATIEPLDEHRAHYRRMLDANLGFGVQACYRGPRLYDTDRTRELLRERVDWFKAHRAILESDVVHGRRADGRDVDWMLHVNPRLATKGMLVVHNPLDEDVARTLRVDLYYTGLTDTALVSVGGESPVPYELERDYTIEIPLSVPAGGMVWAAVR